MVIKISRERFALERKAVEKKSKNGSRSIAIFRG
jgi:hypothetical protein